MKQTDYVILGLLSEAPMTGYQIKRIIDIRFRFFWNESYGQLYPALKALCKAGYIEEDTAIEVKPRAQKTYRLAPPGMKALRDWLTKPVEKESVRLEILLKLYFSHLTDYGVMLDHIRTFQRAHEQDLSMLDAFAKELRQIENDDPAHPAVLRVINFGQKANRAYLDWCRETIDFLEGKQNI
jgi:DNA-binding PadR family transcriptional regulator